MTHKARIYLGWASQPDGSWLSADGRHRGVKLSNCYWALQRRRHKAGYTDPWWQLVARRTSLKGCIELSDRIMKEQP